MGRLAILSALSDKAANDQIIILDKIALEEPRTRVIVDLLDHLPVERNILFMVPERDENLVRSVRNIPTTKVQHISSINVVELLKHEYLILPFEALRQLEQALGDGTTTVPESLEIAESGGEEEEEETAGKAVTGGEEWEQDTAAESDDEEEE